MLQRCPRQLHFVAALVQPPAQAAIRHDAAAVGAANGTRPCCPGLAWLHCTQALLRPWRRQLRLPTLLRRRLLDRRRGSTLCTPCAELCSPLLRLALALLFPQPLRVDGGRHRLVALHLPELPAGFAEACKWATGRLRALAIACPDSAVTLTAAAADAEVRRRAWRLQQLPGGPRGCSIDVHGLRGACGSCDTRCSHTPAALLLLGQAVRHLGRRRRFRSIECRLVAEAPALSFRSGSSILWGQTAGSKGDGNQSCGIVFAACSLDMRHNSCLGQMLLKTLAAIEVGIHHTPSQTTRHNSCPMHAPR